MTPPPPKRAVNEAADVLEMPLNLRLSFECLPTAKQYTPYCGWREATFAFAEAYRHRLNVNS